MNEFIFEENYSQQLHSILLFYCCRYIHMVITIITSSLTKEKKPKLNVCKDEKSLFFHFFFFEKLYKIIMQFFFWGYLCTFFRRQQQQQKTGTDTTNTVFRAYVFLYIQNENEK